MALAQAPQRLALRDLEDLLIENQREQGVLIMAILAVRRRREERDERQERRWWVKPWIGRRQVHGQYYNLFEELDRETLMDYRGYIRMDRELFAEILHRVAPRITKDNRYVQSIIAIHMKGLGGYDTYAYDTYIYLVTLSVLSLCSGPVFPWNPARNWSSH